MHYYFIIIPEMKINISILKGSISNSAPRQDPDQLDGIIAQVKMTGVCVCVATVAFDQTDLVEDDIMHGMSHDFLFIVT